MNEPVNDNKNTLVLINTSELAELLGFSLNRLWALRQDPDFDLPAPMNISKGPRGQRWRLCEIEAWLDSKRAA